MNENDVFLRAFEAHPVGIIFAIGFCILVWFIGLSILMNGWPKFRK